MTQRMTINDQEVPIGEIKIYFRHFGHENLPFTSIDIQSTFTDDSLGGVALNCLNVGNISDLTKLQGMEFSFSANDDSDGELTESVFWCPGDETLEIMRLMIRFGIPNGEYIPLEIKANCCNYIANNDIAVAIVGSAHIEQ